MTTRDTASRDRLCVTTVCVRLSSELVASSKIRIRGFPTRARAIISLWTWPPENAAVASVTKGHPKAIGSLLLLLEQRDRIGLLPDIALAFADLVDRRAGIVKATITGYMDFEPASPQIRTLRLVTDTYAPA